MVTKLPWISFSPFKLERFNLAGLKEALLDATSAQQSQE